jgi:hypothetical protein
LFTLLDVWNSQNCKQITGAPHSSISHAAKSS